VSADNKLTMLAMVLEQAVEYELIDRNPAAGKRRRLRTAKPRRSYLDGAGQIAVLLGAAGELDARAAKGHPGHRHSADARCWRRSRSPGCGSGSCSRSAGATSTSAPAGCGSPTPRRQRACATCACCQRCATNSPS
jgi:hypothetical protein